MRTLMLGVLLVSLIGHHSRFAYGAGQGIRWRDDIERATAEAQTVAKPLLIKFSTSWCGYCKKMQRETFANQRVISQVEQCFVPVTVDGDMQKGLTRQLGVRSYPTTMVISPEMKVIAKIVGFRTAAQLSVDLAKICSSAPSQPQQPRQLADRGQAESVFGGYCPVTPLLEGRFVEGDPNVAISHRGFLVTFQSAAHRDAFQQDPERYWPIADGRCLVSALDEGKIAFGKLRHGLTYRGGIWFFASPSHLEHFRQAPDEYFDRLLALSRDESAQQHASRRSGPGTAARR